MVVRAGDRDLGGVAAGVAVVVTERGLGGKEADLTQRLQRWLREMGKRAEASRALVRRWTGRVSRNSAHRGNDDTRDIGICLALAFPDRISRRRNADGEDWISDGGRAFRLDPLSTLAREEWLAVGEGQGRAAGARILSADQIDAAAVQAQSGRAHV